MINTDFSKFLCRKNCRWGEFGFEMSSTMFVHVDFPVQFEFATNLAFHKSLWGVWPLEAAIVGDRIFGVHNLSTTCSYGQDLSARLLNYAKCIFRIAPLALSSKQHEEWTDGHTRVPHPQGPTNGLRTTGVSTNTIRHILLLIHRSTLLTAADMYTIIWVSWKLPCLNVCRSLLKKHW